MSPGSGDRRGRPGDRPAERPVNRDLRFEAWLREVTADYHDPPSTPAEEMWARVEAGWRRGAVEILGSGEADDAGSVAADGELATGDLVGTGLPTPPVAAGSVPEDELLAAAARYHAPPPPPREEMWARIEGAWRLRRGAEGAGDRPVSGRGGSAVPDPRRRRTFGAGWRGWAGAAAVAAVLLVGIGIGRLSVGEPEIASRSGAETPARTEGSVAAPGSVGAEAAVAGEAPVSGPSGPRVTGAGARPSSSEGATGGRAAEGAAAPEADLRDAAGAAASRLAVRTQTIDHLGRTEAFLTSFRSDGGLREEDREATRWARDLLAETRLLLDWGAERDPALRSLLEELEFVLVRIARLDAGRGGGERELIVDQMEREDVLSRLRTVVPAGPVVPDRTGV